MISHSTSSYISWSRAITHHIYQNVINKDCRRQSLRETSCRPSTRQNSEIGTRKSRYRCGLCIYATCQWFFITYCLSEIPSSSRVRRIAWGMQLIINELIDDEITCIFVSPSQIWIKNAQVEVESHRFWWLGCGTSDYYCLLLSNLNRSHFSAFLTGCKGLVIPFRVFSFHNCPHWFILFVGDNVPGRFMQHHGTSFHISYQTLIVFVHDGR